MTPRAKAIAAICATVFMAFAFSACKGRKAAPRHPDLRGDAMTLAVADSLLAPSARPWTDVQCPVAVQMAAPVQISASGRCTMVRDSLIHLSLRAMGMEAGVVRITPDSVWIVDRYDGNYLAEPLDSILGGYPLRLADIQSLLMGQTFDPQPGMPPYACSALLSFGADPRLLSIALAGPKTQNTAFFYADTIATPAGVMAADISALHFGATGIDASMQWRLKDAKWNTGRRPAFRGPKPGYRRLAPSDILPQITSHE